MLPNTLLTIYQMKEINFEEIRNTEGLLVAEPLGELDLLWIISQLPEVCRALKKATFTTTSENFSFTVTDGTTTAKIEMTNYRTEVER